MTRLHDMGGRFGDGPVTVDGEDAPVFKEGWHAHALAVTLAAGALGQWNLDSSRHARERLSPRDYMRFSYYEKWIAALADLLVEQGVVTRDELRAGQASGPAPEGLRARRLEAAAVAPTLRRGGPTDRPGPAPRFAPGDRVRLRRAGHAHIPGGHTRLPGYAGGHLATILHSHGAHVFPDSHAHGLGEAPQPLYTVALRAADLWLAPEHPDDEVTLDAFEPYLEPLE
ncbi:nitrile hydratase subunit beta [Sediminimonas qiaohouensis]|uniref:nitrile hydratase subunit beta n=1 Tax=Sediminimonas qiaohouensis TaxID=552061 RepID=UPI0004048B17|nr:nitrile hydratase subunit beta [Sediminimonas qiaohouensis]